MKHVWFYSGVSAMIVGTLSGCPASSDGCVSIAEDAAVLDSGVLAEVDAADSDDAAVVDVGDDAFVDDAGPPPCSSEGMFRTVSCECGGTQNERCMDGFWVQATACSAVHVCDPGAFETQDARRCSVEQRVCGDDCQWQLWQVVVPPGECDAGYSTCLLGMNCDCQADCTCQPVPGCPNPPS